VELACSLSDSDREVTVTPAPIDWRAVTVTSTQAALGVSTQTAD